MKLFKLPLRVFVWEKTINVTIDISHAPEDQAKFFNRYLSPALLAIDQSFAFERTKDHRVEKIGTMRALLNKKELLISLKIGVADKKANDKSIAEFVKQQAEGQP